MSEAHDQLADALQVVYRTLAEFTRHQDRENELPLMALMVLTGICKSPGVTVSEIARRLGIAKSHASQLVEDLSRKGLVSKLPDPQDKRLLRLHLSDEGKALIAQGVSSVRRRFLAMTADLPEAQAQRLASDLMALNAIIIRNRTRDSVTL